MNAGSVAPLVDLPGPLVLASASPRRRELLESVGLAFTVRPADIDERPTAGEQPLAYVRRLAAEKAAVGAAAAPETIVIAADTTVDLDGEILGKPTDRAHAAAMLERLSGRRHVVHTGIAVSWRGRTEVASTSSDVEFVALSQAQIEWYVATGEPDDKAGAYAMQGIGAAFVASLRGSVSGVKGLPMVETLALLSRMMSTAE